MRRISGTSLRILEALWRDHHYGQKLGLTLKALASSLPSTAKPGQQLSIPTIRDCLKILSERALILTGDTVCQGRGRPSEVVRLDVDTVITWPSTAAIVLRVFHWQNSMCARGVLMREALSLGLVDQDGNPQSTELIARQIRFAETRGYLGTVPEHDDMLTTDTKDRRVWQEYDYLQFVSNQMHPAPPAAGSFPPDSNLTATSGTE